MIGTTLLGPQRHSDLGRVTRVQATRGTLREREDTALTCRAALKWLVWCPDDVKLATRVHGRLDTPSPLWVSSPRCSCPGSKPGKARSDSAQRNCRAQLVVTKLEGQGQKGFWVVPGSQLFLAPSFLLRPCSHRIHYLWATHSMESRRPSFYKRGR